MPEEKLLKHFEFVAYENKRTNTFFDVYLSQIIPVSKDNLYIRKEKNTDILFREASIDLFERHCDSICQLLKVEQAINFVGIINRIQSYAEDKSSLFQRAVVEEKIATEYLIGNDEATIIATLLDRAFALANAGTNNAIPISLVLNQLTGKWLMHLLAKTYRELYDLVCGLSWNEVFALSQNEVWRYLIAYINAYIALIQDSKFKNYDIPIEFYVNKLSNSLKLASLMKIVVKEAIAVAKNQLFKYGLFSEAQNMELMMEQCINTYSGKYRMLNNVLKAINWYASWVTGKFKKERQYSYLRGYAQNEQKYEIVR